MTTEIQAHADASGLVEMTPFTRGLTITQLCRLCADRATQAGWYDQADLVIGFVERELGGKHAKYIKTMFDAGRIALMHSELSEALEGLRKDKQDDHLPHLKSVAVEMADTLIRIFDHCGKNGIPLEQAIMEKLEYNASRADHKPENRAKEGGKAI